MAEQDKNHPADEAQGSQEEPQGTNWKAESRKWEERAKANKAKADQKDAREEANKIELQKAQELAARYKKLLDEKEAAEKRGQQIKSTAAKYGVDSDMLARMSGDVEENAKFLADRDKARAPRTRDNGESPKGGGNAMAETAHMLFGRK